MQLTNFTARWAEGSVHKVSAQVALQVTRELEEEGRLTAQNLVDVSRPEDAPLHTEFEWDDQEAAEKYRLTQARGIIRNLQIVTPESERPEKVFCHLEVRKAEYTTIRKALLVADTREILLRNARREMEAFQAKYKGLTELAEVFEAMSRVIPNMMEDADESIA